MFTVGLSEAPSSIASISTAFQSGMTSMVSDTMSMVAALVPVIVPLMGASIAIAYTIKFVKKIAK